MANYSITVWVPISKLPSRRSLIVLPTVNGASEEFVSLFLSVVVRSMIVVCGVTERELIPPAPALARAFRAPRNICGPGQLDNSKLGSTQQ